MQFEWNEEYSETVEAQYHVLVKPIVKHCGIFCKSPVPHFIDSYFEFNLQQRNLLNDFRDLLMEDKPWA